MKMGGKGLMLVLMLVRIQQRGRSWRTSFDTIPSIDSPLDRSTPISGTLSEKAGLCGENSQTVHTFFVPVNWTVQRKQWSNNAFFLRASTLTPPVWPWGDCSVGPARHHLLQRRPPRPLHAQRGASLWSIICSHGIIHTFY